MTSAANIVLIPDTKHDRLVVILNNTFGAIDENVVELSQKKMAFNIPSTEIWIPGNPAIINNVAYILNHEGLVYKINLSKDSVRQCSAADFSTNL